MDAGAARAAVPAQSFRGLLWQLADFSAVAVLPAQQGRGAGAICLAPPGLPVPRSCIRRGGSCPRRGQAPSAARAPRRHRSSRIERPRSPHLIRWGHGARPTDAFNGQTTWRDGSIRSGRSHRRQRPLSRRAARDLPRPTPGRGRLQRRAGSHRQPIRSPERRNRILRAQGHGRLRQQPPRSTSHTDTPSR